MQFDVCSGPLHPYEDYGSPVGHLLQLVLKTVQFETVTTKHNVSNTKKDLLE